MSKDIDLYVEFCELREKILSDIKKIAVFSEKRGADTVRPIGIIKRRNKYFEFEKNLAKWREMVAQLNAINPVRYPEKAEKFALIPRVYNNVESFTPSIAPATLSRKYEKENIISRMEQYLENLRNNSKHTGDWSLTHRVERELEVMLSDKEKYYRLRNTCSTEMVCVLYYTDKVVEKIKVPFSGILLFNDQKQIILNDVKKPAPREDSLEYLGVTPLACSLSLVGNLYRESELDAARKRFAAQKAAR